MVQRFHAPWLPTVLGVAVAILAIDAARELLVAPPRLAQFFLLGFLVEGEVAWAAATVHMLFLAWLAFAAFGRRQTAVWGVLGYCAYWIITVWVWAPQYAPGSVGTKIITCTMVTVVLIVICRVAVANREAFDR